MMLKKNFKSKSNLGAYISPRTIARVESRYLKQSKVLSNLDLRAGIFFFLYSYNNSCGSIISPVEILKAKAEEERMKRT